MVQVHKESITNKKKGSWQSWSIAVNLKLIKTNTFQGFESLTSCGNVNGDYHKLLEEIASFYNQLINKNMENNKFNPKKNIKMENNECGNNNVVLHPDFLMGLTDAEGCFSVRVWKYKRIKFKRSVQLSFTIMMLENETEILSMIKFYFNCGILWHYHKDGTVWFRVQDIYSIKNKLDLIFKNIP